MSAGAPAERYNLACAWPLSQPLSGGLPLPAVVAPRSCELLQEPGERAAVHACRPVSGFSDVPSTMQL